MLNLLKKNVPFILLLAVFIGSKIPHLSYPYYWDESWVYVPAVLAMCKAGPSLLPGVIGMDVSRGHPLLFPALFACWVKMAGTGYVAMHTSALLLSLLLLTAVYFFSTRLFNKRVALMSVLLICVHGIFFVDSSAVLPDVLIALLTLCALYYYAHEKYLAAALSLTLLFYTKESGLVLGAVLGTDAFLTLFLKGVPRKQAVKRLFTVLVPALLGCIFLLLQKRAYGWYLNPEHTRIIDASFARTIRTYREGLNVLLINLSEYLIILPLAMLSVVTFIYDRKPWRLCVLIPCAALFGLVHARPEWMIALYLLLFICGAGLMLYHLMRSDYTRSMPQKRFLLLGAMFVLAYLYFSAINYFEDRYLICAMVVMMILIAVFFDLQVATSRAWLATPVVLGLAALCAGRIIADPQKAIRTQFVRMKLQQELIDYCVKSNLYDKYICASSYLDYVHLKDPNTGYLQSRPPFTKVLLGDFDAKADYIIYDNAELYNRQPYYELKKNTGYRLACRLSIDAQWIEVYKKIDEQP